MPALLAWALLWAPPSAPPRLLIAPLVPLKKDGPIPSSSLGNHLAEEFDTDGRTTPIMWGLSDAIFRPAVLEGKLGDVPNLPTRAQALDVARRLGANYVFVYRSDRKDGKLNASGELIVDGRSVWKDAKSMNAMLGSKDSDEDTAASIARTWVQLLITDSLKTLTPKKAATTPDATQGQSPVVITTTPPPPVVTDLSGLEARIGDLMRAGKPDAALALARDAVDADPLSPAARMALVQLLSNQGHPDIAADEARRAADMLPDKPELRIDAVRRLIAVDKLQDAHNQVNELRARFPEEKSTRRLAAELALAEDDGETAIRELDPILKAGDDPEARLLRGLGRARLGGTEGAVADIKAWAAATTDRTAGYAFALRTLSAMAEKAADTIPSLLQRAAVQPKSGAVRDDLDAAQRQAQARAAAWEAIPVPEGGQARHDSWALAHRMMSLVAADLRSFLSGSEDALTAARIDLGEAKQAMKVAAQKKG